MEKPSRAYVQEFDALRGIATLLVVLHHLQVFEKWRVGPDIFFLLSGYMTTASLQRLAGRAVLPTLLTFYRRRLLRLGPPMLLMLAVVVPLMLLDRDTETDIRRAVLAALTCSINWQQALTSWESKSLAHLWSLAAEQQFYLLWPPLFLLCPLRWMKPLLALIICSTVLWRFQLWADGATFNRLFFGLDTHLDALGAGCLLALIQISPRFRPVLRIAGVVSLSALVGAALLLPSATPISLIIAITLTTPLAAAVVIAVDMDGPLHRLLAWNPLQALGRMSYSLYLWNFPIIALVHPHWGHGMKATQIAIIAIATWATYRWVEMPIIRRLKASRGPRPATRTAEQPLPSEPIAWGPAPRLS